MRALTFAILFAVLYWGTVEHGDGGEGGRMNTRLAFAAFAAAIFCAILGL